MEIVGFRVNVYYRQVWCDHCPPYAIKGLTKRIPFAKREFNYYVSEHVTIQGNMHITDI